MNYSDDPGWDPTAKALSALLDRNASLLEVGCATGWFVRAARQYGLDAIGVDVSVWAIEHPAPGVGARLFQGSVLDLAVSGYDAVVSWEMLEHVPAADVPQALARMFNALKPGGLMIHRIALADSEHDHHADDDATHCTVVERDWWLSQFENLGGLLHLRDCEAVFDSLFEGRDWAGRFFAYRKSI